MSETFLPLFHAFGVELEYMIVDRETLLPQSIAHELLAAFSTPGSNEVEIGAVTLSNELAAHVLEFKCPEPIADFRTFESDLRAAIDQANDWLAARNAMLAPGGMHPFMSPARHAVLSPAGNTAIYAAFDRIFNCRSHGWLNLQSCHLNLPFSTEAEFAKLHSAVILLLPYLSALSASSPYCDGTHHGALDTRLIHYAENQATLPPIAGSLVPESVFTFSDYEQEVLMPAYQAIAPFDPLAMLQYDWLNSRGAIARFYRQTIEIRVLDTQERPARDLAICALCIAVLEELCQVEWPLLKKLASRYTPAQRRQQFLEVASRGRCASVQLADMVEALELPSDALKSVGSLWKRTLQRVAARPRLQGHLTILNETIESGSLAERLIQRFGPNPSATECRSALKGLARCLARDTSWPEDRVP